MINRVRGFVSCIVLFLLVGCISQNNSEEVVANEVSFEERSSYEVKW
ncbi:hypothetical protein [Alkalihalobacillus pseudalcaliphilus]|nr:hypothetical protein [Alkalihalobacillus pseudalcaliphilus]